LGRDLDLRLDHRLLAALGGHSLLVGARLLDALLVAARDVFAYQGCDAPVRQIAESAGVGVGTVYRHFPQRSDLIIAVFRRELDACADAAADYLRDYSPGEAVERWMQRYVDFMGTKRGLATALHSGDPAYSALPGCFQDRLLPALQSLLDAAVAAGEIRPGADPADLISAAASMANYDIEQARRMVALLVDGLRHGAQATGPQAFVLSLTYVAVATIVHMGIVLLASMLKPLLASDRVRRVTGIVFALLLVLIAVWLAITTHRAW